MTNVVKRVVVQPNFAYIQREFIISTMPSKMVTYN